MILSKYEFILKIILNEKIKLHKRQVYVKNGSVIHKVWNDQLSHAPNLPFFISLLDYLNLAFFFISLVSIKTQATNIINYWIFQNFQIYLSYH